MTKYKTNGRYKLVSEEAQKEIIRLSKIMTINEIANHFGVAYSTMAKKLVKLTGQNRSAIYQKPNDAKCNIDKANIICKDKGYASALDYISKEGREEFICNIRPLLK